MNYLTQNIQIQTQSKHQMIHITNTINQLVRGSNIQTGKAILFVPHTTAAITINENADPDVKEDILNGLQKTFPNDPNYTHYEGNSDAHIKSSVIGVDQVILIENNSLLLGTWQGIYFMEFDGPRNRTLIVRIEGIK